MAIDTAIVRAPANTSLGNQDFTTSDFGGGTPKGCIALYTTAITNGVAGVHRSFSIGYASGASNENCGVFNAEDGVTTADCANLILGWIIQYNMPGHTNVEASAEFVSFITDGVRINWTNAPEFAGLVTFILFGGSDLSAHADSFVLNDTTPVDVTSPGFEPDVIFCSQPWFTSRTNSAELCLGCIYWNGSTVTQMALGGSDISAVATADPSAHLDDSNGSVAFSGGAMKNTTSFGTFDANGFTAATTGSDRNALCIYLALSFGGAAAVDLSTYTTPIVTGNDVVTTPGFTPQMVVMGVSGIEAVNTSYIDNRGGTFGLACMTPDSQYCTTSSSQDGVSTMNCQSLSDATALNVPDDDGAAQTTASLGSMDALGYTLNYSAAPSTAKVYWALAIEGEAAAPASVVPMIQSTHIVGTPL